MSLFGIVSDYRKPAQHVFLLSEKTIPIFRSSEVIFITFPIIGSDSPDQKTREAYGNSLKPFIFC
ncbi:MAG: hypothetical protein ACI9TH_001208 [Kiritimatiellia bacterium]